MGLGFEIDRTHIFLSVNRPFFPNQAVLDSLSVENLSSSVLAKLPSIAPRSNSLGFRAIVSQGSIIV